MSVHFSPATATWILDRKASQKASDRAPVWIPFAQVIGRLRPTEEVRPLSASGRPWCLRPASRVQRSGHAACPPPPNAFPPAPADAAQPVPTPVAKVAATKVVQRS